MPGKTIMESRVALVGNVGDVLTVDLPGVSRRGSPSSFRDGDQVTLVGFESSFRGRTNQNGMRPGEYANYAWPIVRSGDGKEESISRLHVRPDPSAPSLTAARQDLWLAELPETPFWEDDVVAGRDGEHMTVNDISYEMIGQRPRDGSEMARIYACSLPGGGYSYFACDELTLVERGNVWKIAHSLEPSFTDVEDEASFNLKTGDYDFIRNPETDDYAWGEQAAMQAISNGSAHAFTGNGMLGGTSGHISVVVFNDTDLGERVREHVLASYWKSPAGLR